MSVQHKIRGFTLIEVLIAVLVLAVGLLGLAALQNTSLRFNSSAYHRTIASHLTVDMADRIRNNTTGADGGLYDNVAGPSGASCYTAGCGNASAIRDADTQQWFTEIQNQLPSGTGRVVGNAIGGGPRRTFTITVMWDDFRTGATGTNCGGDPNVDLTCFTLSFQS